MTVQGKVYLIGAGPGDPGLITVKGLRCLQAADAVVYDRLVSERLLASASPQAELIYVGKLPQRHTMKQEEINALLVRRAQEGKTVARLKGGDPYVFGRGGEEAEELAAHGILFEVVPGITAAVAVPAYAGIPITHRGLASSFAVITGHEDPTKEESSIRWDKLATGVDTLVFLMGVEHLSQIVHELVRHGRPADTPAAIICRGATPQQRTISGTLADIQEQAAGSNVTPPAVIVVGQVVRMRDKLRWFDRRPLLGKRVLVTRTREQASSLSELLGEHGAEVIEMPTIQIEPLSDYSGMDRAIAALHQFSWVVFSSANGVDAFFARLRHHGLDSRALQGVQVCAIGPATAHALERRGIAADYVPETYTSAGILAGPDFIGENVRGKRILLPRVENAPAELADGLARLGAKVEQAPAYRTVLPNEQAGAREMLLKGEIDIVTFTSSSTVRNLVTLLGADAKALARTTIACIGPVTADTARGLGLTVSVEAAEHTIPGLVRAIVSAQEKE